MKSTPLALVVLVTLSACYTINVDELDDEKLRVSYSEPFAHTGSAHIMLGNRLKRLCPNGYEKLDEQAGPNESGDWTWTWTARCV